MTQNKTINDLVEELKDWGWSTEGGKEAFRHAQIDMVRQSLTLAYQEGRCSVLAELNHETRQLLDGFAHPKDCEMCRPINEERE